MDKSLQEDPRKRAVRDVLLIGAAGGLLLLVFAGAALLGGKK